jgi:hypothetical protein
MAKKKNSDEDIECIDLIEDEDEGFLDGDVIQGTLISSFSFNESAAAPVASVDFSSNTLEPQTNALDDNRKTKTEANTATPAIDGEPYTIGRYYKLRYSTAKMLNEIKASHPDVNVYMNSIVDEAIRYYYGDLFKDLK